MSGTDLVYVAVVLRGQEGTKRCGLRSWCEGLAVMGTEREAMAVRPVRRVVKCILGGGDRGEERKVVSQSVE